MKYLHKINIKDEKARYFLIFFAIIIPIFISQLFLEKNQEYKKKKFSNFFQHKEYKATKEYLNTKIISPYKNIEHKVESGETLEKILKKYKIANKEINTSIKLIKKYMNVKKITKGNIVYLVYEKNFYKKNNFLRELIIPATSTINIKVKKDQQGELISEKIVTKLFKKITLVESIIKKSLYSSAIKEKVEPNIIIEFARIYGFEIDFQRDIRKNDTFQILYEKFFDENDDYVESGSILYAFMNVRGREIPLYKFGKDKDYGYYDLSAKSVEKALMKTPINGSRLSSSFGMRKHPILGFNKMHKGTDFAAAEGTPIMASGTGTIVRAKWCGGGGNCIKIKHNSTYSTIYAHLKSFARGIKTGKKIRQGEIIGYVGSTGMSTGPHLHYEVLINSKQVNSQTLKLPSGKVLKGEERTNFEIQRIKTDVLISEILNQKIN